MKDDPNIDEKLQNIFITETECHLVYEYRFIQKFLTKKYIDDRGEGEDYYLIFSLVLASLFVKNFFTVDRNVEEFCCFYKKLTLCSFYNQSQYGF